MVRYFALFLLIPLLFGGAHSGRDLEDGHCSKDGCPPDDKLSRGGGDELESVEDDSHWSAQPWNVLYTITDTLTTVKDNLKYNAYKTVEGVYNTTTEFAGSVFDAVEEFSERVRGVFREEFTSFLENIWERAVGTDPANDSLFWKFKKVIVDRVLAGGLIILCLILNYVIWSFSYSAFTALIFILTFNSSVALGYKILGPMWVYWAFWKAVGFIWYIVSYMWTYPYISAAIICGLFLFGSLYTVYQWRRRVERREWSEDMIRSIAIRLQGMEEQQNKIVRQNEELKRQIETLLRRSSSHNSR